MLEENSEKKEPSNQTPGRTHHYWWIWVLALCLAGAGTYAYFAKAEKGRPQVAKPRGRPFQSPRTGGGRGRQKK